MVGYDGGWNVKDGEHSMVHKKKTLVRQPDPPSKWPRWTGFRGKTAWDWMQLLIVPLVLTVLGLSFAAAQQVAEQVIANLQQDVRQQQIEDQRAEAQREIVEQQAQDDALQAYLDVMKELLLERDLRDSEPGSSARAVANVQTSLILERVDSRRKRSILHLLTDSHLIDADAPLIETATLALQDVDARGMDLSDTDLSCANLRYANLEGANLSEVVGITAGELEQQAATLEGATMPNGQKYEDWLKDKKAQGKDEKNE